MYPLHLQVPTYLSEQSNAEKNPRHCGPNLVHRPIASLRLLGGRLHNLRLYICEHFSDCGQRNNVFHLRYDGEEVPKTRREYSFRVHDDDHRWRGLRNAQRCTSWKYNPSSRSYHHENVSGCYGSSAMLLWFFYHSHIHDEFLRNLQLYGPSLVQRSTSSFCHHELECEFFLLRFEIATI